MEQLIKILSERPIIVAVLLSWPFFLWIAKIIAQKIYFKYEKK
jgi:hypothetical protein